MKFLVVVTPPSIYQFVLFIFNIFVNGTKVSRGKVHEYMGIYMEWSKDGTMIFFMIKYLQKIIDYFPEWIRRTSATYSAEYLSTVQ